jgi:hypothetical protein
VRLALSILEEKVTKVIGCILQTVVDALSPLLLEYLSGSAQNFGWR